MTALTVADVADALQVSPRQCQRYIAAGLIRKIPHMGSLIRVAPAELDRFINAREDDFITNVLSETPPKSRGRGGSGPRSGRGLGLTTDVRQPLPDRFINAQPEKESAR